jgi:hypothetical protein
MSKKIDNLHRIIQDLESRYGKDDADVRNLHVELMALKEIEEADRQKRTARTPFSRTYQPQSQRSESSAI